MAAHNYDRNYTPMEKDKIPENAFSQESDDSMYIASDTSPLHPSTPQEAVDTTLIQRDPTASQNIPYLSYPVPRPAYPSDPPGPYNPPHSHYGMQNTHSTTTVIVQQPQQPHILPPRNWSSDLCECGRDCSICCCGLFCSCCLESSVAEDMGESCLLPCCVPGWLITLRTKMRLQENISGSVLDDCCHVCCCFCCTLCQLAYEIKVVKDRRRAVATELSPI